MDESDGRESRADPTLKRIEHERGLRWRFGDCHCTRAHTGGALSCPVLPSSCDRVLFFHSNESALSREGRKPMPTHPSSCAGCDLVRALRTAWAQTTSVQPHQCFSSKDGKEGRSGGRGKESAGTESTAPQGRGRGRGRGAFSSFLGNKGLSHRPSPGGPRPNRPRVPPFPPFPPLPFPCLSCLPRPPAVCLMIPSLY